MSKNNFVNDIIQFIKKCIAPNVEYHLYFEDSDLYEPFSALLQQNFKRPYIWFKRCKQKLVDILDKTDWKRYIKNQHKARSTTEEYSRLSKIKDKYYWPVKMAIEHHTNYIAVFWNHHTLSYFYI